MIEQANIDWSKNHFRIMADGGTWAVPRSGLLWGKHGDELVLLARMPWVREMPITAEQLREQQDADIERHRYVVQRNDQALRGPARCNRARLSLENTSKNYQ